MLKVEQPGLCQRTIITLKRIRDPQELDVLA